MRMVLDDRLDETVDLVIGEEFDLPLDESEVAIRQGVPLVNLRDCLPISQITPRPRSLLG
jgi:hypothetical protein